MRFSLPAARLFLKPLVVFVCCHPLLHAAGERVSGDPQLSAGPDTKSGQAFYVAPDGRDTNPGTLTAPFATPQGARDAVRALRARGPLPQNGVTVYLRAGRYVLAEPLELGAGDAGTAAAPITYRAYQNETPRLVANRDIEPSRWRALGDAARKRVHPKVDPARLRELDVATLGLARARRFAPGNRFTDSWHTIDLFANDRRQPISQWPNPGENIRAVNDPGWVTANGSKDAASFYYGSGGQPEDGDHINELDLDGTGRTARWAAALASGHEVWLKGLWRTPWEPHTIRVAAIDLADNSFRLAEAPPLGMGSKYSRAAQGTPLYRVGSGKENWFALNLLEEIDQPGEWAIDIKDQKLYYYPPAPIENLAVAIADRDTPTVHIEKSAFVTLAGLRVEGGMGNGIEVVRSSNVLVAGCIVTNVGGSGVRVESSSRVTVRSSDIYEVAGAGIELRNLGDRRQLIPAEVQLLNNHIHHIGRLAYREAINLHTCIGLTIAHNLLHDLPKGAVRADLMNDTRFDYNEVHNVALREGDTGAFYTYGGWTTYGNVFRYNFIHHINRANGLYCDDGDSGDVFERNIVHGGINGTHFGGGHDNIARQNLFIANKVQSVDDRGLARNYRLGTPYEKRLVDMKPGAEPWKSYGERLRRELGYTTKLWSDILDPAWRPELPNGTQLVENVSVASGTFRKPKGGAVEVRDNVSIPTIEGAGFRDYAAMDLRTQDARILKVFPDLNEAWPKMGLQRDPYRTRVVTRAEVGGLADRGKEGDAWNEDQLVK